MLATRAPAVAGHFYPQSARELKRMVDGFLDDAKASAKTGAQADLPVPKAMIAPHAGYIYSGPIAAAAYVPLARARAIITRVILLGPAHHVLVRGLATSSAARFATPLGAIDLDRGAIERALALPQVRIMDEAHAAEHSLEVQLPFLQEVLDNFTLVPFVVGDATADEVAEVLDLLWGGDETLVVVSSDLSHYLDYGGARALDAATTEAIEGLSPDAIGSDQACGRHPINGLLALARRRGLQAKTLDVRNSGDTAGPRDQVVGYGAYVFY